MRKISNTKIVLILALIGIILFTLAPQLNNIGKFSSYTNYLGENKECIYGEKKCCGISNTYCLDGTGNIQLTCQLSSNDGTTWVSYGPKTNCQSNVLSSFFYHLEDNTCSYILLSLEDKTDNDYLKLSECNSHKVTIPDTHTCVEGEKNCYYSILTICENGEWVNKGQVLGECYYTGENTPPEGNPSWVPLVYYRFSNNQCSSISLLPSEKTDNDYNTLNECQSYITYNENNSGNEVTEENGGIDFYQEINIGGYIFKLWVLLLAIALVVLIIIIK